MSQKWNSKVQFPTDSSFINRIVAASFEPSKSTGNPMIVLECEIVQPAEVEIGTEKYTIAGVTTKNYFSTSAKNADGSIDEEKTATMRARLCDPTDGLFPKLGIDPATINWDNVDVKQMLGKLIYTMMSPDIKERRKNPTQAQIEAAKKAGKYPEGDVMKNPITGKTLIDYYPQIREIFGLAPQDGVTVAY